jgi:hypothetical protein
MAKITPSRIPPPTRTKLPSGLGVVKIVTDAQGNNLLLKSTDDGIVFPLTDIVDTNIMSLWNSNSTVFKVVDEINNAALEAIGCPRKRSTPKVEKLFSQPKELFEAVDFTDMSVVNEPKHMIPKFIEGEKYALRGVACDGFKMEEKVYELVGMVDEFHGVKVDSVIVKQVGGEKGLIFTLSKNDCAQLGIEYQTGLQLFPKKLAWKRVKDIIPFDKNNLGTTPLSDIDNTVRNILIRLDGFKDYFDGYVLTPSGHLITEKQFEKSVRIQTIEPLVYGNGYITKDKTNLDIQIVYPKGMLFNHGNFISSEDTIYILIKLTKKGVEDSIDRCFGVDRAYFDGVNPNEYFTISWDELGAITIEEYEAEKERKAKEAAERARREEEEKRKRIEAEERRIKEQRKRAEAAVFRMKNYNIKMPTIPSLPRMNFNGSVASVDMMVNSLNNYVKSLNSSIAIMKEDLDTMCKLSDVKKKRKTAVDDDTNELYKLFEML